MKGRRDVKPPGARCTWGWAPKVWGVRASPAHALWSGKWAIIAQNMEKKTRNGQAGIRPVGRGG